MKPASRTLDRRQFIVAASLAGTAMAMVPIIPADATEGTPSSASGSPQEQPFVMVHPAWHGGWCWKKVLPLLRAAGHDVFTPTLTGLGERVHLLSPDIDLDTHIDDVLGVLEYEDLHDVALVGHSSSGMVITGVAARALDRISRLVYLDAFLPEDGKALRDYAPAKMLDEMVRTRGDGWRLPPFMFARDFGITDSSDAEWVDALLGDQPYRTFTQPVDLGGTSLDGIQREYILTTHGTFEPHAERAKQQGFVYHELFTAGHHAMVTQPDALADLLLTHTPS
jgi:pimeloyl-ACP methyl ester carboxylesterase